MITSVMIKRWLALFLVSTIVISYIIIPNSPVGPDGGDGSLSPYRTSENDDINFDDTTEFRKALESEGQVDLDVFTIIGSPSILRNIEAPGRTLYIVTGVEKEYKKADVEILKDFYEKGGKIIIADDSGYANTFSQDYDVHFYGQQMYDSNFDYNVSFPVIEAHTRTPAYTTYEVIMDKPTGFYIRPNTRCLGFWCNTNISVLGSGSFESYVDRNDNGEIENNDVKGPIPVIAMYKESDHDGRIIFISDPDIFTDDLFETYSRRDSDKKLQNKDFIMDLIVNVLLPSGGKVIFDEGRHEASKEAKPFSKTLETITILTSNPREIVLFLCGLTLIILIFIFNSKDKENWVHRFDVGNISRSEWLPEERGEIRDRLRQTLLRKVRMVKGLTKEDVRSMTGPDLASLIKDHQLNELVLDTERNYQGEELRSMVRRVAKWPSTT